MRRKFKGVWIVAALWLTRDLNPTEKVMVAEVDSLDADGTGCFAKNAYFAEFFGLSLSRVAHVIGDLAKAGWLRVELNAQKNDRRLFTGPKFAEICNEGGIAENSNPPIATDNKGGLLETATPIRENKEDNGGDLFASPSRHEKAANTRATRETQAGVILCEYPRKNTVNGTRDASACIRALKTVPFETLRQAVREYAKAVEIMKTEERFIMSAANFFDRERYLEDWAGLARASKLPANGNIQPPKPQATKILSAAERRALL